MERFAYDAGDDSTDWDAGFPSLPLNEAAPVEGIAFEAFVLCY